MQVCFLFNHSSNNFNSFIYYPKLDRDIPLLEIIFEEEYILDVTDTKTNGVSEFY